ncbi:hypothetical protein GBA52_010548 [Prunus armeniaca]|nr:hypothetical protein GBA52_010548 [Prunus armeniaca]
MKSHRRREEEEETRAMEERETGAAVSFQMENLDVDLIGLGLAGAKKRPSRDRR